MSLSGGCSGWRSVGSAWLGQRFRRPSLGQVPEGAERANPAREAARPGERADRGKRQRSERPTRDRRQHWPRVRKQRTGGSTAEHIGEVLPEMSDRVEAQPAPLPFAGSRPLCWVLTRLVTRPSPSQRALRRRCILPWPELRRPRHLTCLGGRRGGDAPRARAGHDRRPGPSRPGRPREQRLLCQHPCRLCRELRPGRGRRSGVRLAGVLPGPRRGHSGLPTQEYCQAAEKIRKSPPNRT